MNYKDDNISKYNKETIQALKESTELKDNPKAKIYTDVEEALRELKK